MGHSKMNQNSISVLVLIIRLGLTTGCGDVGTDCRTVFHPPLDSDEGKSFDIPINTTKTVKLLTTITATYDVSVVGPKMMGSFDTIDFTILNDTGEIVAIPFQIAFQFSARSSGNGIRLRGFRNTTATGGIWDGDDKDWLTKPEFNYVKMFDGPKGNFTIQILQGDSSYEIRVRSPGSPVFETTFYYKSASVWDEYSKYRLSESNIIYINKLEPSSDFISRMVRFESISQCHDAQPVLCGEQLDVIAANLGRTYTLSCRAHGAQFLTSKWRKADKELIHYKKHITANGAGTVIVSEIEIPAFSVNDIGTYTCEVGNDFGQMVKKNISLQYSNEISVLSRPSENKFHAEDEVTEFFWLVEGWPLEVALKCSSQTRDVLTNRALSLEYSPPRIKLTVTIDPKIAPDVINYTVVSGSQVLDTLSFWRVGCSEGQVETIDKKCVSLSPPLTGYNVGISALSVLLLVVVIIAVCLARMLFCSREENSEGPDHESFLSGRQ